MSHARFLRELCIVLLCTGCAVWGTTRWLAVPWVVEGPSMEPTLMDGDRVLVDLWTLRRRAPRPGEVVVLSGPGDEPLVKRVAPDPSSGTETYPPPTLPAESSLEPSFIVLGDNRAASRDSRDFGRVPQHRLRGRVLWRYWPVSRWGSIE